MPAMRSPDGKTVWVPDDQVAHALDGGFVRQASEDVGAEVTAKDSGGDGILGGIAASVGSLASGATLGLSDVVTGSLMTKGEREATLAARAAHPYLSTGGQVVGALAPALLTGGASAEASAAELGGAGALRGAAGATPAGYLARISGEGIEAARAAGGARALVGTAAISGAEAAAQNGGMYLSDVALGDRDLTAEGMAGALGRGFAFGAVAGGATYGIEKGTIAARRMFARMAEGGEQAGADAAGAFDRQTEQVLTAHDDTAAIARKRLDDIQAMKAEAEATKMHAQAEIAQSRLDAFRQPNDLPTPPGPFAPEAVSAVPLESAPAAAEAASPLERQLQEMKGRVDQGASLQDLNAARVATPLGPEVAAEESKLSEALGNYEQRRAKVDDWIAKIKNPRKSMDLEGSAASIGEGQVPVVRGRTSRALDEDVFYERSGGRVRTLGKGEHTLEDLTPNSRLLASSNGPNHAQGVVLDDAYNDAVERAMRAESPAAAHAALTEAADIEQQIHGLIRGHKPENAAAIDQIEAVRKAAGTTGYDAALARAERRMASEAESVPAKLAKGDAPAEALYEQKLRGQEPNLYGQNVAHDAHEASEVLGSYEKAAAELTEAVGPAAPQAAQESTAVYRKAEAEVERKHLDRTTRAIDDHADAQMYGPGQRTPAQRAADAKAAKLEANATIARLKIQETEAKAALRAAPKAAKSTPKLTPEVMQPPAAAAAPSRFDRVKGIAEKVGTVAELAGMAGVPGIPKPSDLPVIGPLLGAYLKFRAFTGKLSGRIPATGEARAASLAARTRDQAARSVDRMLGLVVKASPIAREVAVTGGSRVAEVLIKRIYDDGHPDAPKDAGPQELAAVRVREITAAAANPQGIVAQVRKQMADITDPDLITAAEQHQVAKFQYLADKCPLQPPPSIFGRDQWKPSQSEAANLATRLAVADDPVVALHQVEAGTITSAAAETLRAVYPKLFGQIQQRLIERAPEVETAIPYQQKLRMGMLFDVPLDRLSEPETISLLQTSHAASATTSPAAPTQNGPPMPSIAGPVNLAALYTPTADRRAARR